MGFGRARECLRKIGMPVGADGMRGRGFGGASLRESLDLADFVLDSGNGVDAILFELSFYTVNANYDTDRFSTLEDT